MASLDQLTKQITDDVDGALACAVVDLNSGLLLSVCHNVPYFTQSYLDAVAAAAAALTQYFGHACQPLLRARIP